MILPSPHPSAIFQRIDDGAVVFSASTETYFGLNEVGARIWQLLPPETSTLDDLCARLALHYLDVTRDVLRQDVEELLAALSAEGLVTPTPQPSGAGDPA